MKIYFILPFLLNVYISGIFLHTWKLLSIMIEASLSFRVYLQTSDQFCYQTKCKRTAHAMQRKCKRNATETIVPHANAPSVTPGNASSASNANETIVLHANDPIVITINASSVSNANETIVPFLAVTYINASSISTENETIVWNTNDLRIPFKIDPSGSNIKK